jgi:SAM-dependent methyltransferase
MMETAEGQSSGAHTRAQQHAFDQIYAGGSRQHVTNQDEMIRYIVSWRVRMALAHIEKYVGDRLTFQSPILFGCSGEGGEGSICCDLGYTNVTFSDISPVAVAAGIARDPRLKGLMLDAENLDLPDNSYDVVIVQDGLHHLSSPTRGFTEMIRVARVAAIFIEPHQSMVGKIIGTKWERHDGAVNYVFRWNKNLVEDVASSFLGPNSFDNLSFAYWHHNVALARLGECVGSGRRGRQLVAATKFVLDRMAPFSGNQLAGIVVKK